MTTQTKTTWRKVKLGNVLQLLIDHRGKTPKKLGGNWSSSGIPAISAKNIKNGQIVNEKDIRYVSQKLYDKWMPEKLHSGDILLTSEAPLGELLYLKEKTDYCLSQRLFALRTQSEKLSSKFLYYYLLSPIGRHQLLRRISGTAAEGIRQTELVQLDVTFPENIEEQKRIADILSAFDDKIELNNKISRTLEQMAQAIFKELFVNFRFPGHEKVKMVDSELGKIPAGWEVKNVMEIVKRISVGKKYENKTALPIGKVPILDQGQSGYIGFHNNEPGVMASIDEPVVVFTNHTCNYRLMTRPFSAIQNVLPYVGINGYPTLFVYYLTSGKIKMQEYKGHWPEFEQQEFVVPQKALAEEFVSFVKPMIQKMVEMENENQKLAALRDLLLPKLMSGEIKV
jgi:type I restriction enzyme S subunit